MSGRRVIVCGGRSYADAGRVNQVLDELHAAQPIGTLIEGGAGWVRDGVAFGADRLGRCWGNRHASSVITVIASWKQDGRAAGPMRNARMLKLKPDLVVAFPGGRGTADMIRQARRAGVEVLDVSYADHIARSS